MDTTDDEAHIQPMNFSKGSHHMEHEQKSKKIAIVTGASRGLGRAMAVRLAADGFFVVVHYGSNAKAAETVVSQIALNAGQAIALPADVSDVSAINGFYQQLDTELDSRFGSTQFDVLVNNAGINHGVEFEEMEEKDFDRLFDTNVKGLFFMTQYAVSRLRDGGRIINVGTGLTRFSMPQYAAYSATKGAVNVLTQHLAKHLGPRGITVNTIAPGATDTDMNKQMLAMPEVVAELEQITALGRIGLPEDIGDAVSFLASNDSRWITGERIEVSGGMLI